MARTKETFGEIRYTDLWPDVPMADDSNVMEVYADSIADLKVHGVNFTTTYFTWARNGPSGLLQRMPVVKIIRPLNSMMGMRANLTALCQEAGHGIPSIVPH